MRYVDKARLQTLDDKVIETVKLLGSERDMYIRDRAKYKSQINDFEGYIDSDVYKAKAKRLERQVESLTKRIDLPRTSRDEDQLPGSERLARAAGDVGIRWRRWRQSGLRRPIIVDTGLYKSPSGRQLSCHVGVGPTMAFENRLIPAQTATASRTRTPRLPTNGPIKTLFHMAACQRSEEGGHSGTISKGKQLRARAK
jgi:transposase